MWYLRLFGHAQRCGMWAVQQGINWYIRVQRYKHRVPDTSFYNSTVAAAAVAAEAVASTGTSQAAETAVAVPAGQDKIRLQGTSSAGPAAIESQERRVRAHPRPTIREQCRLWQHWQLQTPAGQTCVRPHELVHSGVLGMLPGNTPEGGLCGITLVDDCSPS